MENTKHNDLIIFPKELSELLDINEGKVRRAITNRRVPVLTYIDGAGGRNRVGIDINILDEFDEGILKEVFKDGHVITKDGSNYIVEKVYTAVELETVLNENSNVIRTKIIKLIKDGEIKEYKKSNSFVVAESDINTLRYSDIDVNNIEINKDKYSMVDMMMLSGYSYDKIYNAVREGYIPHEKRKRRKNVFDADIIDKMTREELRDVLNGIKDINDYQDSEQEKTDEFFMFDVDKIKNNEEKKNYLYRIEKKESDNLFPYTECDGRWTSIEKMRRRAENIIEAMMYKDEEYCDYRFKKDVCRWYFMVLPDIDEREILILTHTKNKTSEDKYRYVYSTQRLTWLEKNENILIKEVDEIKFAVQRFVEEYPEFEAMKKLLNK